MTSGMRRIATAALAAVLAACGQPPSNDAAETSGGRAPLAGKRLPARPASTGVQPETREFREWRAICDNGNRCAAWSGSDDGGWLMVTMDAGPEARPVLSAGLLDFGGGSAVDVSLIVDGHITALRADPAASGAAVARGQDASAMTPALAAARAIQLKAGETAVAIPTSGAAAALLWIDERQGRLGATTALLRKGDREASEVSPAPLLPVVTAAPAVAQTGLQGASDPSEDGGEAGIALPAALETLPAVKTCREQTRDNQYLQKAVLAARLGPDAELWGVPCDSGAYNATYLMFVTGKGGADPRPADLANWSDDTPEEGRGEGLVNPRYDPATRVLSHFPRARGIGDCGVIQSWTWTGRTFARTSERIMGDCWGMRSDLWPTTWRTR